MVVVTVLVLIEYQNRTILFLVVLVVLVVAGLDILVPAQQMQVVLETQML
jgi:hypothetical protein